uniref:RecA family profile 1 domain-containing protein n=1 Tax=Amphora coffeiformis TaxID=265554 RepID=A0A7S3KWX8_9STRA
MTTKKKNNVGFDFAGCHSPFVMFFPALVLVVFSCHIHGSLSFSSSSASFAVTTTTRRRIRQQQMSYDYKAKILVQLAANYNEDEEEDDLDEDDDDDDEPPTVDISQFKPSTASFGWNAGRSSPAQRKGMGLASRATTTVYMCTNCGAETVQWMGRCPTCKEWNTLTEHVVTRGQQGDVPQPWFDNTRSLSSSSSSSWLDNNDNDGSNGPMKLNTLWEIKDDATKNQSRRRKQRIGIPNDAEFNTVLGGGIFPGSLILVGGAPGVGKSTLLLQTALDLASTAYQSQPGIGMGPAAKPDLGNHDDSLNGPVWYVSGEETPEQIAHRAQRLCHGDDAPPPNLYIWQETQVDRLCHFIVQAQQAQRQRTIATKTQESSSSYLLPPGLLVIDSIQTMVCAAGGTSAAGGVTQVRECVGLFLRLAKSTGIPVVLVGHVTKSGAVAGPRTVEHMVDCVLYLEGASQGGLHQIRILRANKNRFGSSDEVGVYEMNTAGRLQPVSDPSSLFLAHRILMLQDDSEGCAVSVALEGRRAVTLEVQALVTMGSEKFSRKTVDGIPVARLQLLLGVLQKRCRLYFSKQDVYVNVIADRLDRREAHAADLAVAVALVSSLTQIPVRADTAFCGQVGLLGELRTVVSLDKRVQEAKRMGFSRIITARDPSSYNKAKKQQKIYTTTSEGIEWIQCGTLFDALNLAMVDPLPKRRKTKPSVELLSSPGSMKELGLENAIVDDEEDEVDDFH